VGLFLFIEMSTDLSLTFKDLDISSCKIEVMGQVDGSGVLYVNYSSQSNISITNCSVISCEAFARTRAAGFVFIRDSSSSALSLLSLNDCFISHSKGFSPNYSRHGSGVIFIDMLSKMKVVMNDCYYAFCEGTGPGVIMSFYIGISITDVHFDENVGGSYSDVDLVSPDSIVITSSCSDSQGRKIYPNSFEDVLLFCPCGLRLVVVKDRDYNRLWCLFWYWF
jgi:hypothetical protein